MCWQLWSTLIALINISNDSFVFNFLGKFVVDGIQEKSYQLFSFIAKYVD